MQSHGEHDIIWRHIWKIKVPERIRHFLWLVCHDKILTNANRCRRNISDIADCPCYGFTEETTLHMLRDCERMATLWKMIIPTTIAQWFFRVDLRNWIVNNISSKVARIASTYWKVIFSTCVWYIWKWRNGIVFEDDHRWFPNNPKQWVLEKADEFTKVWNVGKGDAGKNLKTIRLIGWNYPKHGWVKLNSDGAAKANPGRAGGGGVIRDSNGNWLVGYAANLGICTSMVAEICALRTGLEIAWNKGYRQIQVEMDSHVLIQMLSIVLEVKHPFNSSNGIMQAAYKSRLKPEF